MNMISDVEYFIESSKKKINDCKSKIMYYYNSNFGYDERVKNIDECVKRLIILNNVSDYKKDNINIEYEVDQAIKNYNEIKMHEGKIEVLEKIKRLLIKDEILKECI